MHKQFLHLLLALLLSVSGISQGKISIGFLKLASDSVKASANLLAGELNKADKKNVRIEEIKDLKGANIILISKADLSANGFSASELSGLSKLGVEGFGIISKKDRIFITGNSSLAIQHGVSKYLYLLGFRYYFPQQEWFVYPDKVNYYFKINLFSSPSFTHRYLWYGFGPGTIEIENRLGFWKKMNCLDGSLQASTGHSYDVIVDRHKNEFLKNPDWLVNFQTPGVLPVNPKFDVSKSGLANLVIADTRAQIQQLQKAGSPAYKMISLSPSDGLGTCDTKDCQKIGSVSDRVFYLVNKVAKNIKKDFPGTLIGCLAYSEYIAPPDIPIEDNVYVSLTTAFNNSKYSLDELITLWSKKVKRLGIYDYQALYAWDYDLPGQSLAAAYHTVSKAIQKFSQGGMIGYEAEINTGWINKGLGYYITSQLLWDPSLNSESIADEFFNNCFQSSAVSIKKLYTEWSHFNDPFISQGTLARWIDDYITILNQEKKPAVIKRLQVIGNYLQYLALYNTYKSDASQANLSVLMQQAKLHMNDESVTYYPAMVVLGEKLKGFDINTVIRDNLAKPYTYSPEQTVQWLKQYRNGLATSKNYEKPQLSKNLSLVPGGKAYNFALHDVSEDKNSYNNTTYFVFEKKDAPSSYFELQGDFVEGGGAKLPIIISIYPFKDYAVPQGKPLLQFNYTDRKKWNQYQLTSLSKGLYVLKVEDPKKGFQLKLSPEINYSLFIPENTRLEVGYIHCLYFYVPPGTKSFKFMKSLTMRLFDPSGQQYDYVNNKQEEIEIQVSPRQAGIWRLMGVAEFFKPEGVYPVFGVIPSRMLYPQ